MKTVTKAVIGLSAAGVAYLLVQKSRNEICVEAPNRAEIHGFVNTGRRPTRRGIERRVVLRYASSELVSEKVSVGVERETEFKSSQFITSTPAPRIESLFKAISASFA